MPLTRYLVKNEYGLADPEMFRSADKDDPEALLEGVAMAGLVGLLRQLGDLAELVSSLSFPYLTCKTPPSFCRDRNCGFANIIHCGRLDIDSNYALECVVEL